MLSAAPSPVVTQLRNLRDTFLAEFDLSEREREIACLLIKGLTLSDIAQGLGLSLKTVKSYSVKVYEKTNTAGRSELVSMIFPT